MSLANLDEILKFENDHEEEVYRIADTIVTAFKDADYSPEASGACLKVLVASYIESCGMSSDEMRMFLYSIAHRIESKRYQLKQLESGDFA